MRLLGRQAWLAVPAGRRAGRAARQAARSSRRRALGAHFSLSVKVETHLTQVEHVERVERLHSRTAVGHARRAERPRLCSGLSFKYNKAVVVKQIKKSNQEIIYSYR